jgi:hypothetical protein
VDLSLVGKFIRKEVREVKQLKSRWPAVYVRVPPELYTRLETEAELRVLSVGEIVRERLARAYGQERAA